MDAPTNVLLQHWPGVLFRQATDQHFEFLSPRIADWTGHPPEAFASRPALFFECVHRGDVEALRAYLEFAATPAGVPSTRFRFQHSTTGRVTHVSEFRRALFGSNGAMSGWEGFWQDETRLALAERRLESIAWKEALSELTGGFTHDFNNVFGAVHSLCDTFLSQVEPGHPFHDGLKLMKRDTGQIGQLVQRLQQLHLERAGQRAYHDLNALVTDATELLRRGLSKRAEIVTELAPAQLPIHADDVALRQLIVALVLNAVDAMAGSGRVILRTDRPTEARPPERYAGSWPKPPAVRLVLQDSGPGFTQRQLAAAFEAGCTTRPASLGMGLGLRHARRFAERHCGAIAAESIPGGGAMIQLWLPQSDFTEADATAGLSAASRSILLAGQPASALEEAAQALRRQGFRVFLADEATPELLASADHDIGALLVRARPDDTQSPRLIDFIRRHRIPVKVLVQPADCTADSLDPALLAKADVTIAEDLAEAHLVQRLTKAMSGT